MKKIILPFSYTKGTWHNYSQYLNWIDDDISSLSHYINYFNPSFQVENTTIYSVSSNTLQETQVLWKSEGVVEYANDSTGRILIYAAHLKLREGYFNGGDDVRVYFQHKPNRNFTYDWMDAIELPINSSVIRMRRSSLEDSSEEDFQIIAQPTAGLYTIQTQENALVMSFVSDGQRSLGSSLYFSIEKI